MALLAPLALLLLAAATLLLAVAVRRSAWRSFLVGDLRPGERLAILAGVVAVPVAGLAFFTSTSGFTWDDLKNFRQAQVEALSLDHLLSPTSGHFAPGHRLGDSVIQDLFPMNFGAAQVILLAGFAVSLLLFHRILVELVRPGLVPLLLTLLYGISLTHVGVLQWWASGLDRMPATVATFVSVLAYLRFYRTGSRWLLAVSVAALAVGLLFYVKPVFVPLYLVLLRVLVLDPERSVAEGARAVLREWRVWSLYAVPVLLFSVVYVATYPTGQNEAGSVPAFLGYLFNLWFRVFVPNLFGVFVPRKDPSALAIAGAAAAHAALVAAVAWSVVRRRDAWRAWAFFAIGFALNALIVGLTRVGFFTPRKIAYTLYYNLEITYLLVLALAVALVGRRRSGLRPAAEVRPPVQAAGVAGLIVCLAFAGWGASQLGSAELWVGRRSRTYLDRAAAGLARIEGAGQPAALVDGVAPYAVVPYILVPYNSHSELLPLLDERVTFDATGRDLFRVMRDGAVRPVAFRPVGGGDVFGLLSAQALAVSPPSLEFGQRGLCVTAGSKATVIAYTPTQPLTGEPWYLSLRFGSKRGQLALAAEPLGGGKPPRTRLVNLQDRPDVTTVFALDAVELQRVYLVLSPGGELCVRTLEVGRLLDR